MYICTLTPSSPKFKTVTLFTNCTSGPRGSATEGADAAGLARLLLPVAALLVDALLLDVVHVLLLA